MKAGETTAANPKFKLAHGRNMTSRRSIPTLVLTVNLFVADLLHAFTGLPFGSRTSSGDAEHRINQASALKEYCPLDL
jgi:hypothetical protein